MSAPTLQISELAYLTVDEVKDWLGVDAADTSKDQRLIRLINTATDMVERYIEGPVLNRRYVEQKDGNSSNVIFPSFFPVSQVEEIKIDFNRQFTYDSLKPDNWIVRGLPEMNITSGNFEFKIQGEDIILRDDNNTSILGRMFAGSVIGSIRLTYIAGRGATPADLPQDLVHATLMLVEYLYDLRSNKLMGIKSKTNTNQSFSRDSGIPEEITMILDQYKDYTVGPATMPQKNTFTI